MPRKQETPHLRVRIEPRLLARLEKAREKSRRTLTGEIVSRLESSFRRDDQEELIAETVDKTLAALRALRAQEQSLDAQLQRQLSEVQKQYVAATSATELLTEYRDGLMPQAQAMFRANLAAYESNAGELNAVLLSLNDVLALERDSAQALLDHEIAIAHLENLTGVTLR
jgi:ribosomal protein L16 Arg81 hydroxylase